MTQDIKKRKRAARVSPDADGNHPISNEAVKEPEQNDSTPIAVPLDIENGKGEKSIIQFTISNLFKLFSFRLKATESCMSHIVGELCIAIG